MTLQRFRVTALVETDNEHAVPPDDAEEQMEGEAFGDFTVIAVEWVEPIEEKEEMR